MCTGNAVPAIVCRWAEQTSKGYMWKDIGLQDWLFDFDNEADVQRMPDVAVAMAKDPTAAKTTASAARDRVRKRQRETIRILQKVLKK
jgi:hypothetical protein